MTHVVFVKNYDIYKAGQQITTMERTMAAKMFKRDVAIPYTEFLERERIAQERIEKDKADKIAAAEKKKEQKAAKEKAKAEAAKKARAEAAEKKAAEEAKAVKIVEAKKGFGREKAIRK